MKRAAFALLLLAGPAQAGAADKDPPFSKERLEWNKPLKPFHIIGNIYYVGMAGVSSFLIVTPRGDIVTDGGLPESAPFIEKNIQALGFKLSDVKILLNSHAHFDHSGGLARLKRDTGAMLYAGAPDVPILESGHIGFGPAARMDAPPVPVDHPVRDGDTVSLGGVTLTAHVMPGHTPGCTTWTYEMPPSAFASSRAGYGVRPAGPPASPHRDAGEGRPLTVMFFCSISVAGNPLANNSAQPRIVAEYRASFARLKKMKADIFFAPHGEQFGLAGKLAKVKPGAPNPFIDPGELQRFTAQAEADFDKELARQKAAAKP